MSLVRTPSFQDLDCTAGGTRVDFPVVRGKAMIVRAVAVVQLGAAWALELKKLIGGVPVAFSTPKTMAPGSSSVQVLSETDLVGLSAVCVENQTARSGASLAIVRVHAAVDTEIVEAAGSVVGSGGGSGGGGGLPGGGAGSGGGGTALGGGGAGF
jgi:uncharacterized membrane protein YgcG